MLLVTGGAGFIGSHVVAAALDAGLAVRVLDHAPRHVDPRAELVVADVPEPDAVDRALAGVQSVSHQAAKVGLGTDSAAVADYVAVNDVGTAVLLRALARRRFRGRLVLASSMVIYGEGRYRCRVHGLVRPAPRPEPRPPAAPRGGPPPPRPLRAPVPGLRRAARPRAGRRGRAARPAQRLR